MNAAEQLRQLHDKGLSKLFDTIYPQLKASANDFCSRHSFPMQT